MVLTLGASNATIGDEQTVQPITYLQYDSTGETLIAVTDHNISLLTRDPTSLLFHTDTTLSLPNTILSIDTTNDGMWTVTSDTTSVVSLVNRVNRRLVVHYTFDLGEKVISNSWAFNDSLLLVGLGNGSVAVYNHPTILAH